MPPPMKPSNPQPIGLKLNSLFSICLKQIYKPYNIILCISSFFNQYEGTHGRAFSPKTGYKSLIPVFIGLEGSDLFVVGF